jgi:cephalosporin hydroxylase
VHHRRARAPADVGLVVGRHELEDTDSIPSRPVGARHAIRQHLRPEQVARIKTAIAPLFARDLTRLGRWYGTNKASDRQAFTPIYQQHLAHRRRDPLRILEIGIGGYGGGLQAGGASLRMWRTYFPRAHVVGVDLEPRDFHEVRILTVTGDQTDIEFLKDLDGAHGPFDLIIDDGSHVGEHIITSFEELWPRLASGGTYIIEDTQTAYLEEYGGGLPGTAGTSMELVKRLCDAPNDLDDSVASLHVYRWVVLIDKR